MNNGGIRATSFWIAISLELALFFIGTWDIYMLATGRRGETVSAILGTWFARSRFLLLLSWLVVIHVFLEPGHPEKWPPGPPLEAIADVKAAPSTSSAELSGYPADTLDALESGGGV